VLALGNAAVPDAVAVGRKARQVVKTTTFPGELLAFTGCQTLV
jgi:hypothetical protein